MQVAVKRMVFSSFVGPAAIGAQRQQVLREAELNTRLAHPNLVATYAYCLTTLATSSSSSSSQASLKLVGSLSTPLCWDGAKLMAIATPIRLSKHRPHLHCADLGGECIGLTDTALYLVGELCTHGSLCQAIESGRLWDAELQAPRLGPVLTVLCDIAEGMVRGTCLGAVLCCVWDVWLPGVSATMEAQVDADVLALHTLLSR
ncbi:hypothetical protein QJQ45_010465 [Haematococcus lacustris]|nr:hypothetical protein QJQ45_010465 [Haematococcus lacustris]